MMKIQDIIKDSAMKQAKEEEEILIKILCTRPLFKQFMEKHYSTVYYPDGKKTLEEDGQVIYVWRKKNEQVR